MKKEFTILSRAWYAEANQRPGIIDDLTFGVEGSAEMIMLWKALGPEIVPQLTAFDDSWNMFRLCPDVFEELDRHTDKNITVDEFAAILTKCGFVNVTPYKEAK